MLIPVLLFIVGLLFLIKGGDWFVDGASALARRFHLPELLIGATVVSIGTTLPEVMVSTMSALSGHGEIAYGNAIGSVICNAALIAAITIAVRPGRVDPKTLKTPVAFFFAAASISLPSVSNALRKASGSASASEPIAFNPLCRSFTLSDACPTPSRRFDAACWTVSKPAAPFSPKLNA